MLGFGVPTARPKFNPGRRNMTLASCTVRAKKEKKEREREGESCLLIFPLLALKYYNFLVKKTLEIYFLFFSISCLPPSSGHYRYCSFSSQFTQYLF